MTFEEAKQRNDYKYMLNGIEDCIEKIRNNWMEDMYEDGEPQRDIAVLRIGYVDVEVNLFTEEQITRYDDQIGNKTPVIDYFVCIKYGENDDEWESDNYLDYQLKVNWNADDWVAQLERDMFEALDEYVNKKGYSYDHANVTR